MVSCVAKRTEDETTERGYTRDEEHFFFFFFFLFHPPADGEK